MVNTCFNQGLTAVINDTLDAVPPETNSRSGEWLIYLISAPALDLHWEHQPWTLESERLQSSLENKLRTVTLHGKVRAMAVLSFKDSTDGMVSDLRPLHTWTIKWVYVFMCVYVCRDISTLTWEVRTLYVQASPSVYIV